MKKLIFIFLVGLCLFGVYKFKFKEEITLEPTYLDKLDLASKDKYTNINKYTLYGKYLNLFGEYTDTTKLVLLNLDSEIEYELFEENNEFATSKNINKGIDLEKIDVGNYIFMLKTNSEEPIYYNLVNNTEYSDLYYYSFPKENNKCNEVKLSFKEHNGIKYLGLDVTLVDIPNNYYDVTLDPGHGKRNNPNDNRYDPGACNNSLNKCESPIMLDLSNKIKTKLEEKGLKVAVTRKDDKTTGVKFYGENSRISMPYDTKSKLFFALHMNSSGIKSYNGLEVYLINEDDRSYSRTLYNTIREYSNLGSSPNTQKKVEEGLYIKNLNNQDYLDNVEAAKKGGWEPYNYVPGTVNNYYFLRETGGIMTHAYVDGRNTLYDKNIYYNSNYGAESYLLELGYISNTNDLNNMLNNMDNFADGIAESILKYITS